MKKINVMAEASRATLVVVNAPEEQRWADAIVRHVEALWPADRAPLDVVTWNRNEFPAEHENPPATVALILMSNRLLDSSRPDLSTMRTFRVMCEPLKSEREWLTLGTLLGTGLPLSQLRDENREGELASIAAAIVKSLTEPPHADASGSPSQQTAPPTTAVAPAIPLSQLSTFTLNDSIAFLLKRAGEMLSGAYPAAISRSALLFALAESGTSQGWVGHFLRQFIDRHSVRYETIRDDYFKVRGTRGVRAAAKTAATLHAPEAMTASLSHAFERAREIATRTTGQNRIHARHLFAALLQDPDAKPSGALARFSEMGIEAGAVREAFFDWLRGYGDREAAWTELLLGAAPQVRQLTGFSTDRVGETDLLDIEPEVRALSALIAARTVTPPLSIGLFGDWGSGKTFFMRALRSAIDGLASEARDEKRMQRDLPFYKNIVQIEFNAWHYVEGNLWASLVEHILENLYQKKDAVSRGFQEALIKKLADEKALAKTTSDAVDQAKAAAGQAKQDLRTAQIELDKKTTELAALNAKHVGRDFVLTGAAKPIADALEQLGLGQVGESAKELEGALRQIHAVLGRGQRFATTLTRAKDARRRFVWLLLFLIGAPATAIVVRAILQYYNVLLSDVYAYLVGLATLLASGATWLKHQAEWMSKRLDQAETAQSAFDSAMAKETAEHVANVTQAEQKLRELTAALDSALQNHVDAKGREAAADAELKAATTGRLLANFISDRAASGDYRKHLGVLALVRDDFEKLSGLIEEENWRLSPDDPEAPLHKDWAPKFTSLEAEAQDADKRINRIVLYIDDLDRCPPNNVVEVLQAVHLLLAFHLFVVVVGVDARWVTRSLQTRYRQLLHVGDKSPAGDSDADILLGSATPNDYLEKIFQIPFWLKPIDATSGDHMVRGLLRSSVAKADRDQTAPGLTDAKSSPSAGIADTAIPAPAPGGPGTETVPPPLASTSTTPLTPTAQSPAIVVKKTTALTLESLEIVKAELDYMTKLAPILGRSPRALTRFANVYRLIKVGLAPHEQRAFLRPRAPLSDYQIVLFLLAVDTGTPMVARSFFAAIGDGVSAGRDGAKRRAKSPVPADIKWLMKRMNDDEALVDRGGWQRLNAWLLSKPDVVPPTTELSLLLTWSRRVGRYSFEVGRS